MNHDTIEDKDTEALKSFDFLLLQLRAFKPNDRSERDRYWAITITEVEKALAIFKTFAVEK